MDNLTGGSLQGMNLDPKKIATNIIKEIAPNMSSVAISAMDGIHDFRDFINRSRSSMNIQDKQMSQSPLIRSTNSELGDIDSSIQTSGKSILDELDMISANFDEIMSDLPELPTDEELMNDPTAVANSNSLRGAEATTRMTAAAASATVSTIAKSTEALAKAQMKSAAYIAKSQSNAQLIAMTKINTQMLGINKRLDILNSNVANLIEFNNKNVSLTNQRSLQYMHNSEEMLKAIVSMYNKTPDQKVRHKDDFGVLDYGYIDPHAIADHVKQNFNKSIFGVLNNTKTMMQTMLFGDGLLPGISSGRGGYNKILETVTSGAAEKLIKSMLPMYAPRLNESLNSLGALDQNLFKYMRQAMLALGDQRSSNPLIGLLGDLVGVKGSARSVKLDKFSKDAMPWNGLSQKYLTEVIPSYLANIEKGVLQLNEARHFDPSKGRFYTESEIRENLRKSRSGDIYEFDDTVRMLTEALSADVNKDKDARNIQNELNRMINQRLRSDKSTDPNFATDVEALLAGVFNSDQMRNFIMNLEDGIYESRRRENRRMHDVGSNIEGSIYRTLLMNGDKYADTLDDLDIFKSIQFDRFGRRIHDDMDEDYVRAKAVADMMENPARKYYTKFKDGKLGTRYEGFRTGIDNIKIPFTNFKPFAGLLPALPELDGRRREFRNTQYGPDNKIDVTNDALYDMVFRGNYSYLNDSKLGRIYNKIMRGEDISDSEISDLPASVQEDITKAKEEAARSTPATREGASAVIPQGVLVTARDGRAFNATRQAPTGLRISRRITGAQFNAEQVEKAAAASVPTEDIRAYIEETREEQEYQKRSKQPKRVDSVDNRPTLNQQGGVGKSTGATAVTDIDKASQAQIQQEEMAINKNIDNIQKNLDNGSIPKPSTEDSGAAIASEIREGQAVQTEAIIEATQSGNKLLSLNLGKIFGKDGKIAKFFQSETAQKVKAKVVKFMFGEKGDDRVWKNGLMSGVANVFGDAADYMKYVFNGEEYVDRKGKRHPKTENAVFSYFKNGFDTVFNGTMTHMFGEDYENNPSYQKTFGRLRKKKSDEKPDTPTAQVADKVSTKVGDEVVTIKQDGSVEVTGAEATVTALVGDQNESVEQKQKSFMSTFKKHLPKVLAGGIAGAAIPLLAGGDMGILGNLFLPGGPVGGAIVGMGLTMLTQSETFQKIMFGDKDIDGKRTGGIINEKMRETFKKIAPFAIGGAALGILKSAVTGGGGITGVLSGSLLPGGVIGAALLGAGLGIVTKSERFQNLLFGDKKRTDGEASDDAAKSVNNITQQLKDSKDFIFGGVKGLGAGLVTGAVVSKMGVLGAALGTAGPIGFGLAGLGLGIASQTDKFQNYFWGNEKEDGTRRRDGLVHRFQNFLQMEVFDKVADAYKDTTADLALWARGAILSPINKAFGPLLHGAGTLRENIQTTIKDAFQMVGETVAEHTKKAIDDTIGRFGRFMMKSIIQPLAGGTLNIVKGVGKTAVNVAMSPVHLLGKATSKERERVNDQFMADFQAGNVPGYTGKEKLSTSEIIKAKEAWAKENHPDKNMSWMWQDEEDKLTKFDRKELKRERDERRKVDQLRSRYAKADKYNELAEIDPKEFKRRKAELAKAGVDVSTMNSVQDLRNFMYRRETPTAQVAALTPAEQKQEARDTRDENYQKTVVELLRDQLTLLSGGKYRHAKKGKGKLLSERDAHEISIVGAIVGDPDKKEEEARKSRELAESKEARALTAANIAKRKLSLKETGATAVDSAKTVAKSTLDNPVSAIGTALLGAMLAPAAVSVGKTLWTENIWPFMKENVPDFITSVGGAAKEAFTGIREDLGIWFNEVKPEVYAAIAGIPGAVVGTIKSIFGFGGEETIKLNPDGSYQLDKEGKIVYGEANANTDLLGSGARLAAGLVTGRYKSGDLLNFATDTVKNAGRTAVGAVKGLGDSIGRYGLIRGTIAAPFKMASGSIGEVIKGMKEDNAAGAKAKATKAAGAEARKALSGAVDNSDLKGYSLDDLLKKAKEIITGAFDKLKSTKGFEKIASNTLVDKIAKSVVSAIDEVKAAPEAIKAAAKAKLPGALGELLARTGSKVIPGVNLALTAAFAVWDVSTGALEAASIFNVDESDVTGPMRLAAAILKGLTGLFGITALLNVVFELVAQVRGTHNTPTRVIAGIIHNIIVAGDEEAIKKLNAAQFEYDEEARKWIEETGGTYAEYDNERKQSAWSNVKTKVTDTVKTIGTKVVSGAKSVISNVANFFTGGNKATSTGSGIGFGDVPQMSQYDPRWANMPIGMNDGQPYTMGSGGCGPTSLAMVAQSLGRGVNPAQIGAMARDSGYAVAGGSSKELFTEGASKLGLKSSQIGGAGIESELAKGKPVILSGKGSGKDGTPYTKVGHIVTASGIDNEGNVIVNDPRYNEPTKYPLNKVKQGMRHGWSYSEGSGDNIPKSAVYYSQGDNRWAGNQYGSATIGRIGCVMTSLAMALSSLTGESISPADVVNKWGNANWVKGEGTSWNVMPAAAKDLGLEHRSTKNVDEIVSAAEQRKPVVLFGSKDPGSIFGNGGSKSQSSHSVVAINGSTQTGEIVIHDPGKGYENGHDRVFDKSALKGRIKQGHIFSKGGKGIGPIDPSAIAAGVKVDTSAYNTQDSSASTTTPDTSSSSSSSWMSGLTDAMTKMANVATADYDRQLFGTSVGSGDDTSVGFSKLSSALGQMANVASAEVYSKLMGTSYADAKAKIASSSSDNQSETAGTDIGYQYDPNAPVNASYKQYDAETSAIVNKNLKKFSMPTEADMNGWFARVRKDESPFHGNGKVFIEASEKSGLDPRYIAAHAALESGWGTSAISKKKHNYFGIGAFDSSPYASAYSFAPGLQKGIVGGAQWISDNYTNKGYDTLAKMKARGYATDPEWAYNIARIMKKAPEDTSVGSGEGIAQMATQKFATPTQDARTKSIEDKLNVAVNVDGVEGKLDALIDVVRDIFTVTKDRPVMGNTVNIGSGDTNVNVNGKNSKGKNKTIVVNNQNKEVNSTLRGIHELVARTSSTPA